MAERLNYFSKPKRDFETSPRRLDKISLESIDSLEELNAQFSETFPHWDGLIAQYQQIKFDIDAARKVKGKDEKWFSNEELCSLFSEIHLRNYLEKNNHIQTEMIPHGATTTNFLFERSLDGRLHVYDRAKTREYCEYDALAYFDDLPVLYEIKMCNFVKNGKNEKIEEAIDKDHIRRVFKPLSEFFDTKQFAYSLVIPPEEIRSDSLTQKIFKNEGGLIAPFCMKNNMFRGLTARVRNQYRI